MKKFIFALIFLLAAGHSLEAQTLPGPEPQAPVKNILKISPFHFIEGTFLMSYERMLAEQSSSIMISLGVHSRERFFEDSQQFGFQEELQYRFYLAKPNDRPSGRKGFIFFKGLYAGPFFQHRFRSQDVQVFDWILQQNIRVKENINEFSGGVIMGVQLAFGNKFFVDFYTGGGIKRSVGRSPQNTNVSVVTPGYNGVLPKIGFRIGVGF